MAAGLGFKTFTTGEVLTAGDVNGYLMQGINVFTNATARDAAITAPAEGQFAFTKDNNSLWYYDGAAWVASGATGDIEGVTATSPLTGGGTSGTVTVGIQDASTSQRGSVQLSDSTSTTSSVLAATPTAVKSAYDLANGAIPKTLTTTTGDTIYASSANTPARLGIGTTGQVLTVSGGVPTWATPASGGGMTLLATTNCSGSSSITFSSISQSYKHLLITWDYIYNTSASSNMYFQFNSGVSLSWSSVDLNGTSLNGASGGGYSATQSLATPNNSTPGNTGAMWVYDYANTSRYKSFALQSHGYSTATSSLRGYHNYGLIENPSSGITSINLTNGATWGGGQVRLWGLS